MREDGDTGATVPTGERGGAAAGAAHGERGGATAGAADELAREMAAFDATRAWSTEELLKESPMERTELVADAAGQRYIRKYIDLAGTRDEGESPGGADAAGNAAAESWGGSGAAGEGRDGARERHPYEMLSEIGCPFLPHVRFAEVVADKLVVVTDYVPGCDLRALVEGSGPVAPARARRMLRCMCMALSALHEAARRPIVHRDVNPGNIIVHGEVAVLVDLGVARVYRDDAAHDTRLLGTAGYTAPEQYGFRQTDARADIYSLGMVVRFMLTGREPGERISAGELPAPLAAVVETATRLDPARRYASVRAMHADLEAAFDEVAPASPEAAAPASPEAAAPTSPEAPPASPDTSAPATTARGTGRTKPTRVLWRMCQALLIALTAIMDAALVAVSVRYTRPEVIAFAALMGVFLITIPMMCLANPGDWLGRLRLFSRSRHPRIWRAFAVALASIVVFIIGGILVQTTGADLGEPF